MKYYSDITKKLYENKEALAEAEKAESKKQEQEELKKQERATEAKEIELARKKVIEDYNNYTQLINAFIDKHGSFHATFNEHNSPIVDLFNLFF